MPETRQRLTCHYVIAPRALRSPRVCAQTCSCPKSIENTGERRDRPGWHSPNKAVDAPSPDLRRPDHSRPAKHAGGALEIAPSHWSLARLAGGTRLKKAGAMPTPATQLITCHHTPPKPYFHHQRVCLYEPPHESPHGRPTRRRTLKRPPGWPTHP